MPHPHPHPEGHAMIPAPFRAQLSAALGFPATFTPTDEQIIDAAKATAKRADDAEMELARVHGALDDAKVRSVSGSVELGAVDRVRLLAAERDEARASALRGDLRDILGYGVTATDKDMLEGVQRLMVIARNPADLELHALRDALGLNPRVPDAEVVRWAAKKIREAPPEDIARPDVVDILLDGLRDGNERGASVAAIRALLGVSGG